MNKQNRQLNIQSLYLSNVYWIEIPEFLETARNISYDFLNKTGKSGDSIYPVKMTDTIYHQDIHPLIEYICNTGWNVLDSQGFDMRGWAVMCDEFWCQEHEKYSGHEEHVHHFNFQLTGMYFLDVPEDSCQLVFHDPRPAKRQINMYEKNINDLTYATMATYYNPMPGMLYLSNSWLPHSFTRNKSEDPFRFIHFNLSVVKFSNPNEIVRMNTTENLTPVTQAEII